MEARIKIPKMFGATISEKGNTKWFSTDARVADIIIHEDVGATWFAGNIEGSGPEILKIYGDRYTFSVESKNVTPYSISPKLFIFTSNYEWRDLLAGAGHHD